MKPPLVIIPCGSRKQKGGAVYSAARLYTGPFHLACQAYALSLVPRSRVMILSALHGLVTLDQPLKAYDLKMGQPGCVDTALVLTQARTRGLLAEQVVAVGGKAYLDVVRGVWPHALCPFAGLPMGLQMQALKRNRGQLPTPQA